MGSLPAGVSIARGFSADRVRWPLVPARDLFELRYGRALVEASRVDGDVPVYGTNGRCGSHIQALFPAPGVILGRKGQGPLGVEWSPVPYWVIDTAYCLAPLRPDVDLKYAYYLIKYVGLNHLKDGTSNPTLSRDAFGSQAFPWPSLRDQERIAQVLSVFDDKTELNRRTIETLEQAAQTLFTSWFLDSESDPSDQGVSLSDAVDLLREPVDPRREPDTVFRHYSLPAYDAGREPISEPGVGIRSSKLAVPPGSVLLSKLNPDIERVWLPDIRPDDRAICSTEFLVLRPRAGVGRGFVYEFLRSAPFRSTLTSLVTGTTGSHQRAHAEAILQVPLRLADPSRAAQFERMVGPMLDRIAVARRESQTLVALQDSLLPSLLSGEAPSPSRGS